jgi:hypothetical protein
MAIDARKMAAELVAIIEPVLRPEEVRDAFEEFLAVIDRWLKEEA